MTDAEREVYRQALADVQAAIEAQIRVCLENERDDREAGVDDDRCGAGYPPLHLMLINKRIDKLRAALDAAPTQQDGQRVSGLQGLGDDQCPKCGGSFEATGGKPSSGPYQCQRCTMLESIAAPAAPEEQKVIYKCVNCRWQGESAEQPDGWRCPQCGTFYRYPVASPASPGELPKMAIDHGPDPDCLLCKGSGECSNAIFRCICRWRRDNYPRKAASPDERGETPLVERLRKQPYTSNNIGKLFAEAADAIERLLAEREALIQPLKQSDNPEEAEAMRSTPEYVLIARWAADKEAEIHRKRREELQTLRTALELAEAAMRRTAERLEGEKQDTAAALWFALANTAQKALSPSSGTSRVRIDREV